MKNQNQKSSTLIGIVAVIIVAIICGGGFLAWKYYSELEEKEEAENLEIETLKDETADWKTYRNEEYEFEFRYPSNYKLNDNLTKKTCCLQLYSSTVPLDDKEQLKKGVLKVQFAHYESIKPLSNEKEYIDFLSNLYIDCRDIDYPGCGSYLDKNSIVKFVNKNGIEITKYSTPILENEINYAIPIKNNFSNLILVEVWNHNSEVDKILSTFKFID